MTKRIKEIETLLREAKAAYYNGEALMSDSKYDALENELFSLDPKNAIFTEVGTNAFGDSEKVSVGQRMFSTDKSMTVEALTSYRNRIGANARDIVVSTKVDGLAVSIEYKDGVLVQAVTRGNGLIGQDVTAKIKMIPSIPNTLAMPFTGRVRGECFMTYTNFDKLNAVLVRHGEAVQSNPRNSTAALLNAKNIKNASKKLALASFEAYGVYEDGADEYGSYGTYTEQLAKAEALGFKAVPAKMIESVEAFEPDGFKALLDSLDHPCDGVVLRVNDNNKARALGTGRNYLNAVTAFKYAPEIAIGVVKEIEWSAGTREISPVVILENPVELDGAQITRIMGHTVKNLIDMGAAPGCEVAVVRSGGVIPKLVPMPA